MFEVGDVVKHNNGSFYIVEQIPVATRRLESSNTSFYEYRCVKSGVIWLRGAQEFEDGRFKLQSKDIW